MSHTYLSLTGLNRVVTQIKNLFVTKADPVSSGSASHTGNVSVTGIIAVGTAPTANTHVATKQYVDTAIGDVSSLLDAINGEVI